MNDEFFMRRALELAYGSLGNVSPNPSVGAVLVRDGKIIAEGVTQPPGGNHAEVEAITRCAAVEGATLYVTLEPCCHEHKRTPPCTSLIIGSGIKRVVMGAIDRNPHVSGKSADILRAAGIAVAMACEQEAQKAHEFFFTWITKRRPFVTIKVAMTIDGKLTWGDGVRKQITGQESKHKVHDIRSKHDAILVGVNTIIKDDPQLTCRLVEGNPTRVILDSSLRTPRDAQIFKEKGRTILCCTNESTKRYDQLCEIIIVSEKNKKCDVRDVLQKLGAQGMTSILVEGGTETILSFLHEKLADKMISFIGPQHQPGGTGFLEKLEKSLRLRDMRATMYGEDTMIEGYL